ncbi:MAG: M81 family metallopeptidase [Defluviitaleaceae bacterium]|nr:M81 family metallopeptidase [Defluviitaleaceae bacterium]
MRVFAAGIHQESNSFTPLFSTVEDFRMTRGQEFRETAGVAALIDAGCEVVESVWARAVPGGTLRLSDFLQMCDEMLEPLWTDKQGFDGVFLPMHGALDVEHIGSGETFLAARVREMVGQFVPIAAPMDMHGNLTYGLVDACNIILGYRTAPHTDVWNTHARAAEMLVRAMKTGILPHSQMLRIPLVMPGENMMTESGIGKEIIARLPDIEKDDGIWCTSYFAGMAWVDTHNNGACVVVSGDRHMDMEGVLEFAQFVWNNREKFEYQGLALEPEDAVDFAKKHAADRPVIISDSADNVTAGAAGDNALMLNHFIQAGIENSLFAAIIDPLSVEKISHHNIGDTLDITIGGCFDENAEKAALSGAVVKIKKPHSCVISYKNIDILLFYTRKPVFDVETLAAHGLNLDDYNILVVKQGYLSPELLALAKHAAMALTPGNCNQKIERLSYKKLLRPVYPLDPEMDWSAYENYF